MELGSAPFSQPCGEFHGREEVFSGSIVPHPATPSASDASNSNKAHPDLEQTNFTTRDARE
jgi:hypothetical protein